MIPPEGNSGVQAAGVVTNAGSLVRVEGWEKRLAAFIEARRTMPFAWGVNDCVSFGIDAVAAITGVTTRRVTWTTAREALAAVDAAGGLAAALTAILGTPHDNWRRARRGDVVLTATNDLEGGRGPVMICLGEQIAGPGVEAMQMLPVSLAVKVWRVG